MRQYIDDFRLNANRSRDSDDEDTRGRLLHRFQGDRKPRRLVQQRGALSVELPVIVIVLKLTVIAVVLPSRSRTPLKVLGRRFKE